MSDQPSPAPSPVAKRLGRFAARARTLAVVYLVVLFVGTHLPSTALARLTYSDKFMHAGGYAMLTLFVLAGWELTIRRLEPKHYFAVWLVGTMYAAFDEVTQIPVGRSCDINDWARTCWGSSAAFLCS
jgi:VanZ family protein